MSIPENLQSVRARVTAAATRAGRNSQDVALMAVCKTVPVARICEAYDAGQRLFGENRVQEFADKWSHLHDLPEAEFHMIGHLQANKAGKAAELFSAVDSLDSLKLAEKLNAAAEKFSKCLAVLVEINLGGEQAKSGLPPDSPELQAILSAAARLRHLQIRGLMTIPPLTDDPEGARPYFRQLRQLREQIERQNFPNVSMQVLSMGMSHDFEVAIEEGSTCVRIGTAIFGERPKT